MEMEDLYVYPLFIILNILLFWLKYEQLILDFIALCMILVGITVFVILLFYPAPYGRYTNRKWGWQFPVRYSWIIQECPSFLIPLSCLVYKDNYLGETVPLSNVIGISMFMFHYFQRSFIYPLLIRGGKPTPCIPWFLAFVFCTGNGYMQGRTIVSYFTFSKNHLQTFEGVIGIVVFLLGMGVNLHSDHVLRNLRKPGETGYKIPRGGVFNFVSGANFLGEIIEWTGYAIYCWNFQSFAFAFFTYANLVPRALKHHKFYLEKFEDYPKSRKAIFPGIL